MAARASPQSGRGPVLGSELVRAGMAMRRFGALAIGALAIGLAVLAGETAVGLFGCYGESCSYELRGYTPDGPGANYGVLGGLAALVAVIALAAAALALRAAVVARGVKPAVTCALVALAAMAVFVVAIETARV